MSWKDVTLNLITEPQLVHVLLAQHFGITIDQSINDLEEGALTALRIIMDNVIFHENQYLVTPDSTISNILYTARTRVGEAQFNLLDNYIVDQHIESVGSLYDFVDLLFVSRRTLSK